MKKRLSPELHAKAIFAILDLNGNINNKTPQLDEAKIKKLCSMLDGMEIDGVRFAVDAKTTDVNLVLMSTRGDILSDDIIPNHLLKQTTPLLQVIAKKPEAKQTASVLNKFIYRSRKLLAADSAVILIRDCEMQ